MPRLTVTLMSTQQSDTGEANEPELEPIHRLHSYCARFPSEVAESAIVEYTKHGDSICDPFCGSGTSLTAGLVLGRRVVGSDIDVLAGMLSSIKCAPHSADAYRGWRAKFETRVTQSFHTIEKHWPPRNGPVPGETLSVGSLRLALPGFPELNYWFPPRLVALLAAIADAAHRSSEDHMQQVALVSLSAAIIAKWPSTLSYAMDVDHTRPHRVVQAFSVNKVLATYRRRLDRTVTSLVALRKLYRDSGVLSELYRASLVICPHDAREPTDAIADESQSLIVTSPPYFNAVDYPRAHRLSVCWMNGRAPEDLASRKNYIGLRHVGEESGHAWFDERPDLVRFVPKAIRGNGRLAKIAGFFGDLDSALTQMWRVLRPGGHAVIVIADNAVKGHRIESHAALAEIARQIGFEEIDRRPRAIDKVRRRFPVGPFGFDGPMTHEHVVVLRRPLRASSPQRRRVSASPRRN